MRSREESNNIQYPATSKGSIGDKLRAEQIETTVPTLPAPWAPRPYLGIYGIVTPHLRSLARGSLVSTSTAVADRRDSDTNAGQSIGMLSSSSSSCANGRRRGGRGRDQARLPWTATALAARRPRPTRGAALRFPMQGRCGPPIQSTATVCQQRRYTSC